MKKKKLQKIIFVFDTFRNVCTAIGLKKREVIRVQIILEEMFLKEVITTEYLRRYLGEMIPGSFGLMADALGVTLPTLDNMLQNGELL